MWNKAIDDIDNFLLIYLIEITTWALNFSYCIKSIKLVLIFNLQIY